MQGKVIIQNYTKRWQLLRGLEGVLYGLGIGLCVGFILKSVLWGSIAFTAVTGLAMLFIRPWKISLQKTIRFIDNQLNTAEYSAGLVLMSNRDLSGLAQLQQQKIGVQLATDLKKVKPKTGLKRATVVAVLFMLLGVLVYYGQTMFNSKNALVPESEKMITFQSSDSVVPVYKAPVLVDQKLTIRYPDYTQVESRTSSRMNIKVVEGSQLFWNLSFDGIVNEAFWEGLGDKVSMRVTTIEKSNSRASQEAKQSQAALGITPGLQRRDMFGNG